MKQIAQNVRINTSGDPLKKQYDVVVEVLKNGNWEMFRGFNSFTNDYAFTSANEVALDYARKNPPFTGTQIITTAKLGPDCKYVYTEYEVSLSDGATLFPLLAYVAYEKGCCGDDPCGYGATPTEAVTNLRDLLEA